MHLVQHHSTIFWLYITVGVSLISNFRVFLVMTTPVALACIGVSFYLTAKWVNITCECAPEF